MSYFHASWERQEDIERVDPQAKMKIRRFLQTPQAPGILGTKVRYNTSCIFCNFYLFFIDFIAFFYLFLFIMLKLIKYYMNRHVWILFSFSTYAYTYTYTYTYLMMASCETS